MLTKAELEGRLHDLIARYGEWTYDIPLPHGVWTRGNEGLPHTRIKRVLQVAHDLAAKPLHACRVLDLGCLDGQFSVEFALHGATVVGLEAREANLKKALFAKEALRLDRLEFIHDDVRNISRQKYGAFDVILCSGLLYHLNTPDIFAVIDRMYEMVVRLLLIDTHISLSPERTVTHDGKDYRGHDWREHTAGEEEEIKAARSLASWGNDISFTFSRPSLINYLSRVGFSSIYECFNPPHLNFGQPGLEHQDRCTFVALKEEKLSLHTSPVANALEEDHPEGSLSYASDPPADAQSIRAIDSLRKVLRQLARKWSTRMWVK